MSTSLSHLQSFITVKLLIVISVLCLTACAKTSPRLELAVGNHTDGLNAQSIFNTTFSQHGGEHLPSLNDINIAIDGDWHYLITKIQPDVTDESYRQQSEERLLVSPRLYAVNYVGGKGTKQVLRTANDIEVTYDNTTLPNASKKAATALTADAFYIFALGPLALSERVTSWKRLKDGIVDGKSYYRINGELQPGIGLSTSDYITLWINKQSGLTFRMHITLEGFDATKGAHVDTRFLEYAQVEQFILPIHFFERVLGPIKIDAHEWWYTGLDINRGLKPVDLILNKWSIKAQGPAKVNFR